MRPEHPLPTNARLLLPDSSQRQGHPSLLLVLQESGRVTPADTHASIRKSAISRYFTVQPSKHLAPRGPFSVYPDKLSVQLLVEVIMSMVSALQTKSHVYPDSFNQNMPAKNALTLVLDIMLNILDPMLNRPVLLVISRIILVPWVVRFLPSTIFHLIGGR